MPTENAARYVEQLCKHWAHKLTIERSGEDATVVLLNDAVVRLAPDAGALHVTIEAKDEDDLAAAKDVVVRHLDRFAFREAPLDYGWS